MAVLRLVTEALIWLAWQLLDLLALPYFPNNCCILMAAILDMDLGQEDCCSIKAGALHLVASGVLPCKDFWLKIDIN